MTPWETWNQQFLTKMPAHQKYLIQSNSLSWAKRNKSLCVSLNPPLKESRLIRKNGRASYFIDVFVLLYFVHTCLDLYSMFVFDSVKRPTIKLDKTQKGELWTLVVKKHASDCKLCVDRRSESGVQWWPETEGGERSRNQISMRDACQTRRRHLGLSLVGLAEPWPLIGCW